MNDLTTTEAQSLSRERAQRQAAGQAANEAASANVFNRHLSEKSQNTKDAQLNDLATFAEYLCRVKALDCGDSPNYTEISKAMQTDPATWHDMTWGLVDGFREWMLRKGYALSSINRKLSTVKVYAQLAAAAGVVAPQEGLLIRNVKGYSHSVADNVNAGRVEEGIATRTSTKKEEWVKLTRKQRRALKSQPDTPQGRRDAVIMALLLDHGLRVGELALLEVTNFDLAAGEFRFYRPKVKKEQIHKLETDAKRAIDRWFDTDAPAMGPLLRGSQKGGKLTGAGMSERAITERVRDLGASIGVHGLSAHDCRHSWATQAAKKMRDPIALKEAGGWNSLAMPAHYVDAAAIANDGITIDDSGD